VDKVRLNGIVLFAHLGVHEAEREAGQKIQIDVELTADLGPAGRSDSLAATIDYQKAYRLVEATVDESRCRLLETLATTLIDRIFAALPVTEVTVRVRKPNVPFQGTVSAVEVELCRRRGEAG
jgi:dihydroneopterin aldolase